MRRLGCPPGLRPLRTGRASPSASGTVRSPDRGGSSTARSAHRARARRRGVDGLDFAPVPLTGPGVDGDSRATREVGREVVRSDDRGLGPRPCRERSARRCGCLSHERRGPGREATVEEGGGLAEHAQHPHEAGCGAAPGVVVGDDATAVPDAEHAHRPGERVRVGGAGDDLRSAGGPRGRRPRRRSVRSGCAHLRRRPGRCDRPGTTGRRTRPHRRGEPRATPLRRGARTSVMMPARREPSRGRRRRTLSASRNFPAPQPPTRTRDDHHRHG